ncbi:MAG: CinA family protein [Candidatus Saccharimonadales bacterium]
MISKSATEFAAQLVRQLASSGFYITTVESCTGGALANAITNIPGSGDVFKDGFVTYSNQAKIALGVSENILLKHTMYSLETARAMAEAGLARSTANPHLAVGITGTLNRVDPENPKASAVGEVFIAILKAGTPTHQQKLAVPAALSRHDAKQFVVASSLHHLLNVL